MEIPDDSIECWDFSNSNATLAEDDESDWIVPWVKIKDDKKSHRQLHLQRLSLPMIDSLKLDCPAMIATKPIVQRSLVKEVQMHYPRFQRQPLPEYGYQPIRKSMEVFKSPKMLSEEHDISVSDDALVIQKKMRDDFKRVRPLRKHSTHESLNGHQKITDPPQSSLKRLHWHDRSEGLAMMEHAVLDCDSMSKEISLIPQSLKSIRLPNVPLPSLDQILSRNAGQVGDLGTLLSTKFVPSRWRRGAGKNCKDIYRRRSGHELDTSRDSEELRKQILLQQEHNRMKFLFFKDFNLLTKHENAILSDRATDLLYKVDDEPTQTFTKLTASDIASMCWNLFYHLKELDVTLDRHVADEIIDVLESDNIDWSSAVKRLGCIVESMKPTRYLFCKAMVGHIRRMSLAYGEDISRGLAFALGPILFQRPTRKSRHIYISPNILKMGLLGFHQEEVGHFQYDWDPIDRTEIAQLFDWSSVNQESLRKIVFEDVGPLQSQSMALYVFIQCFSLIFGWTPAEDMEDLP